MKPARLFFSDLHISRALLTSSALLFASLFLLGGCAKNIPPPDNALEDPAELRQAVDARVRQIEDARFKEIVLDYFGDGERVKVRQLILVKQPDMLRVQTRLPGTDSIMSLLVTDGDTFAMHKRESNEYFTGEPTPQNISLLLPVDLSAADVVRVMLGGAPWDRFDRSPAAPILSWERSSGQYLFEQETPQGGALKMRVRHTDFAVTEVTETDAAGETTYRYSTSDWAAVEGVEQLVLPKYRRFIWPARDLDFSIDIRDTQINPELPDAAFQLEPPAGSSIIHVDER